MEKNVLIKNSEEIERLIPEQIPQLRKILKEKHNLIVPAHCDDLIARCIRMKDGNLESAINLVRGYHCSIQNFHNWDAIFQPTRYIVDYHAGTVMVTSQRDLKGRIIFICRVGVWEPDTRTFDQCAACLWMLLHYISAVSKDTQRNGIVTIWDFNGFAMKHVWATKKWRLPQLARIVQNGIAGRIKEFHAINHQKIFTVFFSTVIQPFLKDKFKKRIIFHDKLETLHLHIDKNGLPTFAGGSQEIQDCMDWNLMNTFLGRDQYFIDMMNDRFPRY